MQTGRTTGFMPLKKSFTGLDSIDSYWIVDGPKRLGQISQAQLLLQLLLPFEEGYTMREPFLH